MITVSRTCVISLDHVQKAVRQVSMETSVTKSVVVVQKDVTETRGSVKGHVLSVNTVHSAKKVVV